MAKRNPCRFNFCLDPMNPLHRKASEVLNAIPRNKKVPFIVESIVIASQSQVSLQDWLIMQSEFLSRTTLPETVFTDVDAGPALKATTPEKKKKVPAEKKERVEAGFLPEQTPAVVSVQPEQAQTETDLKITFNDEEGADDEDLDDFLNNLKAFGVDF